MHSKLCLLAQRKLLQLIWPPWLIADFVCKAGGFCHARDGDSRVHSPPVNPPLRCINTHDKPCLLHNTMRGTIWGKLLGLFLDFNCDGANKSAIYCPQIFASMACGSASFACDVPTQFGAMVVGGQR